MNLVRAIERLDQLRFLGDLKKIISFSCFFQLLKLLVYMELQTITLGTRSEIPYLLFKKKSWKSENWDSNSSFPLKAIINPRYIYETTGL